MNRRAFVALALIGAATRAKVQAATKVARIAYLSPLSADSDNRYFAAFRRGMREHGYIEGSNLLIDVRYAAGKLERLPLLADELARHQPDLFVTYGAEATSAADKATSNVPVVISNTQDPVASGLVTSLARPGGKITGMSDFHAASSTKRLELLKETLPGLKRLALFWRPANAPHRPQIEDLQRGAPRLGVALVPMEINQAQHIAPAFATMHKQRADALLMLGDSILTANMKPIIDLSMKSGIPAMYTAPVFADLGGMFSYGSDIADLCRRAAGHVDKILKGAKAGDLPIEQATQFELVVNLRTAKAMKIAIPRSILLRANRLIE